MTVPKWIALSRLNKNKQIKVKWLLETTLMRINKKWPVLTVPAQRILLQTTYVHDYRRTRYGCIYLKYRKSIGLPASTSIQTSTTVHPDLNIDEFQSYREALQSKFLKEWMVAFKEKYDAQIVNEPRVLPCCTFQAAPKTKPIGNKWIGKFKPGYGDFPLRFKGRLTAVGYSQCPGIDYGDVYAAVPRLESFQVFVSLIASEGFDMVQIDIKTVFLNAVLDFPVNMKQPSSHKASSYQAKKTGPCY